MATNTKIKIRLQGHEKFALRDGWLTKGLSIIDKRPDAFWEVRDQIFLALEIIW